MVQLRVGWVGRGWVGVSEDGGSVRKVPAVYQWAVEGGLQRCNPILTAQRSGQWRQEGPPIQLPSLLQSI